MQQALNEGYIDVPDVVTRLRSQRAGAVQVAKQYAFIHASLATQLSRLQNGTCVPSVGSSWSSSSSFQVGFSNEPYLLELYFKLLLAILTPFLCARFPFV